MQRFEKSERSHDRAEVLKSGKWRCGCWTRNSSSGSLRPAGHAQSPQGWNPKICRSFKQLRPNRCFRLG